MALPSSRLGMVAGALGLVVVAALFVWMSKGMKTSRLLQLARMTRYVGICVLGLYIYIYNMIISIGVYV